jgi:alkylation response protein AidB-like acyl-CoA dehydrogenase
VTATATGAAPAPGSAPVDLVAAAVALRPLVEAHADEGEELRRLPVATLEALRDAQLLRMCVPRAYGGPEADPVTLVRAIEAVAEADGAAGWCTMIASTTASLSMFLPPETARAIYGDPQVVTGGAFAPSGRGESIDGGFRVTGRWQWGSGTEHCQWIAGGTSCDDGTFRLAWFDAADVTFHDTWHVSGMRGTGSLDYSVDGAFVPVERTMQPMVGHRTIDSPLAAFPNFSLLASGVAAVSLGVGRRAIDELVALAAGKRPMFSSRTLAHSAYAQIEISRAEAALRSARAFLLGELAEAWEHAVAGGRVPVEARARIRLACVNAAEQAVRAADAAYTLGGGSSVFASNPLQRCLRDAHVATQHLQVAPKLHETLGKLLLGVEADTAAL